jgi:signal transduction histidine kinase
MNGLRRPLDAARRHAYAVDAAIAAGLFTATLLVGVPFPGLPAAHLTPLGVSGAAAACGALLWRRRWPVPALATTMAGATACLTLGHGEDWVVLGAPMIALYTVAERTNVLRALAIGGLVLLALAGAHTALLRPGSPPGPRVLGSELVTLVALGGLAVAAGDAARSRRAYIAEVEGRARRAERNREQEATRRVAEERLRIARDLHDVLGHQIALINVQAGVADHVLDEQPAYARRALAHIRQASRVALRELRDTIGLLRQRDEPDTPTEPTGGLWALAELVDSFRRSGLRVECDVDGEASTISAATDVTAYRIVQESLTNVRKHAGSAVASVRISREPLVLRIVVEDDGLGQAGRSEGEAAYGIAGMRERAVSVGGSLEAGPLPSGGFRVSAVLPLRDGGWA